MSRPERLKTQLPLELPHLLLVLEPLTVLRLPASLHALVRPFFALHTAWREGLCGSGLLDRGVLPSRVDPGKDRRDGGRLGRGGAAPTKEGARRPRCDDGRE